MNSPAKRIVYMGTSPFAVPALQAIANDDAYELVAVYTQPPRPAGRNYKEQKTAVHKVAEQLALDVLTPLSLKGDDARDKLSAYRPDIIVVASYGMLLPKSILDICPCYNIHASLLPKWRGAAPIERSILAGDVETGVTIMHMDVGLDTGDMLLKRAITIGKLNGKELHDSLSDMGAKMIIDVLGKSTNGALIVEKQNDDDASYAAKLDKSMLAIDWQQTVDVIGRYIQAFAPKPGMYTVINGKRLKILDASYEKVVHNLAPGTASTAPLAIAAKDGLVKPLFVQLEGKKAMSVEQLLCGFNIENGTQCS